ncbi:MAG: MFS transporter [Rhodoferax sp.]
MSGPGAVGTRAWLAPGAESDPGVTGFDGTFGAAQGWRYGLMGLPLAFVALPLYVLLPNHYARQYGLPLALLGALLLGVRLLDTVIDPLLGRWADRAPSASAVLRRAGVLALLLALGFGLLLFPPPALQSNLELALWLVATLALTTLAFSALSILHQAWGAQLGGNASTRARVVAWREGLGLVGVMLASVLPSLLGLAASVGVFALALALACWAWGQAPRPSRGATTADAALLASLRRPWRRPAFARLMAVFMLNGIASAVPATLMLFFVQDRLQVPAVWEPAFLGAYFACAALSLPLWLRAVGRFGLAPAWALGMGLAVGVFAWAAGLGAGDALAFLGVCALSGVALGADLALPGALLAGVIQRSGDSAQATGAYMGWWACASKANLALAAGLALPAVAWLGYAPGRTDAAALHTLTLAYCVLPCVLKAAAAALLMVYSRKGWL